jgi:pheromone shutdown protein TraB
MAIVGRFGAFLAIPLLNVILRTNAATIFKYRWGKSWKVTTNQNTTRLSSNFTIPAWKTVLPDPLPSRRTLERIQIPLTTETKVTLYLLGTSHVSNDSSADVRVLLEYAKPEVVFLELCDQRIPMLLPKTKEDSFSPNSTFWERVGAVQEGSGMSRGSAIGTVLLTQVQDDYAESLGVDLGGEFRVAWEYCQRNRPICILGDRPLKITLLRAWESLSWWGKSKCLVALLWSSFQKPNPQELREWMRNILEGDSDVLTESMAELRKTFPSLERVILKERDAYLACKIYQTCRYLNPDENHTLVAIVGAGHGPGVCQWLTDGNGQSPEDILRDIVKTKKNENIEPLIRDVTQLPYDNGIV